ncbi:MAG TPA: hypothetical protein VFP15_05050 [Gemmatimonadaceae bacterium]|nr:hypothetical protein [Gemmatimonadaceae bacterium]
MPQPFLPYALVTPTFPFRHLATLAGRAPIGGTREVALGCFMAARLAAECGRPDTELTSEGCQARATSARSWLGALTLPPAVRTPIAKCIESSGSRNARTVAHDVTAMRDACATYLDAASRTELDALIERLTEPFAGALPARASEP